MNPDQVPDYGVELGTADTAFAVEVRAFLARALTAELRDRGGDAQARIERAREWQSRLFHAGLAAISWPEEYGGRSATPVQQLIYNTEIATARAPEPINRSAINHLGPTIIQWGTAEQQHYYLPRILSAAHVWCQGFSEPDAGSDLAALRTHARVEDSDMIISGQKIWTSKADYADHIYLLVRTESRADRHDGITFVLADLDTTGVEVRPIRQISGRTEFSEVFFDEVRVPLANVVGPLHGGWAVARSTLSYERVGQSRTHRIERRLDSLIDLARAAEVDRVDLRVGSEVEPAVADRLVRFAALVEALRQIAAQATASGVRGTSPGPESSIAKLLTSETDQAMSAFALELAGPAGVVERGNGAAGRGSVALGYLVMRAATVGAGTSEIQRNIIAEKLLGLPRDNE